MKYRKKDIGDLLKDKNWEGVKAFADKFGMKRFIMLDRIVREKDVEKLKAFVEEYGIEPLVEYGMPVGGEGVKELYDISDRLHGHKRKTGAEWWLRDEVEDAVRQLKGHADDDVVQERVAMLWKDVDAAVEAPPEIKADAFRKVLMLQLIRGICRPVYREEKEAMERMIAMFEKTGFSAAIRYEDDFTE